MECKTLFEKLMFPGVAISAEESVLRNIQMIFSSGRLLDGEGNMEQTMLVQSLLDQPAGNGPDLAEYKWHIEQMIKRHEPRVDAVEVDTLDYGGAGCGTCVLKLRIHDIELTQNFEF